MGCGTKPLGRQKEWRGTQRGDHIDKECINEHLFFFLRMETEWANVQRGGGANQFICRLTLQARMATPDSQSHDVLMIVSPVDIAIVAPAGIVHVGMPALTTNASQQATWLWERMQNHHLGLWYVNWVNKTFRVDPLHPRSDPNQNQFSCFCRKMDVLASS